MADGTFAALLFIVGLTDMGLNHCGTETGCLGRGDATPRLSIAGGEVLERRAEPGAEVFVRYDLGTTLGPFQPVAGLSVGERGELWAGFGQSYTLQAAGSPLYGQLFAMTGLYEPGDGLDLGGPVAFRSGIELGYETRSGWRVALSYDHRSNAGLYGDNPGVETVMLKVSVPLE